MVVPGTGSVGRASATLIWVSIALVLADVIAYRAILGAQGGPPPDSVAVRSSRNAILSGVAGAVIAVTLLLGGFEVTQRIIVCPTGTMGGGGSGFLTGPYHYTCVNGKLTMYSGDCNGVTGGFDANGNPISANGC